MTVSASTDPSVGSERGRAAVSEVGIDADIQIVFGTLVDPETYPEWLVGAQVIRSVDDHWPEVGAAFHHSIGVRPLLIHDRTAVVEIDPPHLLILAARAGPLGLAGVRFELSERGNATRVQLVEQPWEGPMRIAWKLAHLPGIRSVGEPISHSLLWGRNAVSLDRLKALIEPDA